MIIVNLKGGLGNQMFQYAFGRKLALKNNDTLKLEVEGLQKANEVGDIYRPFSLGRFNIIKDIASHEEVSSLKYPYGLISKAQRWFKFKILKNTYVLYEPRALKKSGDQFLDGYWQSPKYFDDIRDTLIHEFTLAEPLPKYGQETISKIQETESVSMHIRRGDYIKNPQVLKEFGVCSKQYYQDAIANVERINARPSYFVFSDDINWVKNNIGLPKDTVYVSNPDITDTEELYMMSQCKHNIIANSTFSWWAAWLNQYPGKMVICPTPWFEGATYDPSLISESWIQIPKN